MGIGNTTPAAALIAWCLSAPVENCVGPGTGINQNQHAIKCKVIEAALARHKQTNKGVHSTDPHKTIQSLGGFELAAMAGAALAAANSGVHILLDGVIATASLLPFALDIPTFKSWIVSAHCGSEPAHLLALQKMELEPLLRLQLRLGEGTGAALAAGLMCDALKLLNEMATFDSAQISGSGPL